MYNFDLTCLNEIIISRIRTCTAWTFKIYSFDRIYISPQGGAAAWMDILRLFIYLQISRAELTFW